MRILSWLTTRIKKKLFENPEKSDRNMDNLNKLELELLLRLSLKYPDISSHLPCLKVTSRENTGVGMYVNFEYLKPINASEPSHLKDADISTNENIKLPNLKYGLGYEVCILDGRIKFIEFITYGETWNGETENFSITHY